MKNGRSKSISVVTTQGIRGQKRKYPYTITSNEKKTVKKQNTMPKVMARMCLPLIMPPRMGTLRENATIATSLGIKRQIAKNLNTV